MNKKGKITELISGIQKIWKSFKQTYLYKIVSKFLTTACSIILVILLIVGAAMFYFNTKVKAYDKKGLEYTTPFGLYTIISGSMEPNVEVYDVVIAIDEDINKIKIGDVITFISTWDINYGMTITHRVIDISRTEMGEVQLTTKGDNNPTSDGSTVTQKNLVGKVVGRIPQLGRLQFFLATKMGWFLVVFIPAIIIIILDGMKILKLYVLKNQIDNVKTPKEAEKVKRALETPEKKVLLSEIVEKKPEIPDKQIVEKDENIDTVELPKVGEDGIIKENTSELPTVKDTEYHSGHTEIISILNADLGDKDVPTFEKSVIKKEEEDIGLPILKKNSADEEDDMLPKRKELKRRE